MDDAAFAAEAARAWEFLLPGSGSSARAEDGDPSLRRLVEAAVDEPVLRALCPWISMNSLNVSTSTDFRGWGREGFPALVAWHGEFTVVEGPGRENRVLLETDDPAQAVAYLADWLRAHRG